MAAAINKSLAGEVVRRSARRANNGKQQRRVGGHKKALRATFALKAGRRLKGRTDRHLTGRIVVASSTLQWAEMKDGSPWKLRNGTQIAQVQGPSSGIAAAVCTSRAVSGRAVELSENEAQP